MQRPLWVVSFALDVRRAFNRALSALALSQACAAAFMDQGSDVELIATTADGRKIKLEPGNTLAS